MKNRLKDLVLFLKEYGLIPSTLGSNANQVSGFLLFFDNEEEMNRYSFKSNSWNGIPVYKKIANPIYPF